MLTMPGSTCAAIVLVDARVADLGLGVHHDLFAGQGDEHAVAFDRARDVGDRFDGRELRAREKAGQRKGPLEIGAFAKAALAPGGHEFEDQHRAAPVVARRLLELGDRPLDRALDVRVGVADQRQADADQPAVALRPAAGSARRRCRSVSLRGGSFDRAAGGVVAGRSDR